jgi:ribosomal-protein-alanine N-acetyltransferase
MTTGLAIESATEHVELLVRVDGETRAHVVEDVGHGHTRRLAVLLERALGEARIAARALEWVAADLGPGSFTGVRVGLATAQALAMVAGARLLGASSLAALAHGSGLRQSLVIPLVPAGRRDLYAGFFRAERSGEIVLVQAPLVGLPELVLERAAESIAPLGRVSLRFIGPGVARARDVLEAAYPGSVLDARAGGLSAYDLAHAASLDFGPPAGLPRIGEPLKPEYVRTAQAEERVRHRVLAATPISTRPMSVRDLERVVAIEREIFPDPWPESAFKSELGLTECYARIAERDGQLAGYLVAWLGEAGGHLGNVAVVASQRRRGVAAALLDDLLTEAGRRRVRNLTLEVRVSNAAAQALYRSRGFRLAAVRRRYYRDIGEDALVMEWRPESSTAQAERTRR